MAGKERFTTAEVIEALRKTNGMKGPTARLLGCTYRTVVNYEKRYRPVADCIREERELMLDAAELSLARAVEKGEAWAVCFTLKTIGKGRGYVEKTEVEVLVKRELQNMFALLEDELEPDEFMKVAGILSRRSS
jgi:hypothetical protein